VGRTEGPDQREVWVPRRLGVEELVGQQSGELFERIGVGPAEVRDLVVRLPRDPHVIGHEGAGDAGEEGDGLGAGCHQRFVGHRNRSVQRARRSSEGDREVLGAHGAVRFTSGSTSSSKIMRPSQSAQRLR
jgi:hypothetical protein